MSPREHRATQLTFNLQSAADELTSEERQLRRESIKETLDDVRRWFGCSAIGTGIDFDRGELSVATQRDRHALGPESQPE